VSGHVILLAFGLVKPKTRPRRETHRTAPRSSLRTDQSLRREIALLPSVAFVAPDGTRYAPSASPEGLVDTDRVFLVQNAATNPTYFAILPSVGNGSNTDAAKRYGQGNQP
jgi:hypothetical protein